MDGVEPRDDLADVEPEQSAPLVERDAALADEPANVADRHAEMSGKLLNTDQLG